MNILSPPSPADRPEPDGDRSPQVRSTFEELGLVAQRVLNRVAALRLARGGHTHSDSDVQELMSGSPPSEQRSES